MSTRNINLSIRRVCLLLALLLSPELLFASNNYATYFGASENPISQNSRWVNGLATGLDWTDVRVDSNGARNTQTGLSSPATNDSIAVLTGTWGANQQSEGIVRTTNQPAGNVFEEFELLLRFNVTAHSATGYEVLFSANKLYAQIVRWNGALNTFQVIGSGTISALVTGDVLKATISGSSPPTITGYVNGTSVVTTTDDGSHGGAAYTTGNPGIGLYYQTDSSGGVVTDYSFTSFITTDASIRDAASCSSANVQSAMTAANTAYDIVSIAKSGSPCHWTAQVTWSAPANAIVQCRSVINSSFSHSSTSSPPNDGSVTIIDDRASSSDILTISSVTGTFRMYGCTLEKGTGLVKDSFGLMSVSGTSTQFRFDHNRINLTTGTPVNDNGAKFLCLTGVADHNQIDLAGSGTGNGIKVGGCDEGDVAWNTATGFGSISSSSFMYFEDNYYPVTGFGGNGHSNPVTGDCDHGGKQALRYSVIGTTATTGGGAGTQTHPTGGSGPEARGCRATEFYGNTLLGNATHSQTNALFFSSGGGLIWNNSVAVGYENFVTMHSMLKSDATYPEGLPAVSWGYCAGTPQSGTVTVDATGLIITKTAGATSFNVSWTVNDPYDVTMIQIAGTGYKIKSVDSTTQVTLMASADQRNGILPTPGAGQSYVVGSAWNENSNTNTGKRCMDQPGNGVGDLLVNNSPGKLNQTLSNTVAWPRQALEPVYMWADTPYDCTGCDHHNFLSVYEPSVLTINENYYKHVNIDTVSGIQTSTTVPFDGSAGTGFGTHTNRPVSCTSGVAYFETDTGTSWLNGGVGGQLFVCVANAWPGTAYYVPYTYPHPLVNGDTSPPAATISSLTPSSGAQGATSLSVAVVGLNSTFVNATTVCYFGANITVNSCTVSNSTHLTASITIAAGAITGARDATFTTGAEVATSTGGFTVNAGGILIKKISPRKFRKL